MQTLALFYLFSRNEKDITVIRISFCKQARPHIVLAIDGHRHAVAGVSATRVGKMSHIE